MKQKRRGQKRRGQKHQDSLSGSVQPDDGLAPRFDRRNPLSGSAQADRKAAQLCVQIHRALDFVVPQTLVNTTLDAIVLDVQPAPNTAHLLVLLQATASLTEHECSQLELVLTQNSGVIRTAVAQSIHRRKTPTLSFRVTSL